MRIAFLGLGRMGQELVKNLLDQTDHDLVLWNRSAGKLALFKGTRAHLADSAASAVDRADLVLTCLFGPDAVRQVVMDPGLLTAGDRWCDISTIGPVMAAQAASWAETRGIDYVHSPVLGSLGPAAARDLGVLIGGASAAARAQVRPVVSVWADPQRIVEYDSAAKAASGKLIVNYGLAVGMQAIIEAVRVGMAGGLTEDEAVSLLQLPKTPLSIIANMKGALLESGDYSATQFSTNLLAKDVDLMLRLAEGQATPALTAAFASLEHARRAGCGESDFAAMAGLRPSDPDHESAPTQVN
ncbi:MAG: NAD-binding protein [Propionibacteriaceae bacterium]|jgi:3-hydroxyisobutyrate dehydrogenase|nr:NAD-binding protein [Propionibacteriaceae bacterium]